MKKQRIYLYILLALTGILPTACERNKPVPQPRYENEDYGTRYGGEWIGPGWYYGRYYPDEGRYWAWRGRRGYWRQHRGYRGRSYWYGQDRRKGRWDGSRRGDGRGRRGRR